MSKRKISALNGLAVLLAAFPLPALAHGPGEMYVVLFWYGILLVASAGYLLLGRGAILRRLTIVVAALLVSLLVWWSFGFLTVAWGTITGYLVVVFLGLVPVFGGFLGVRLAKLLKL